MALQNQKDQVQEAVSVHVREAKAAAAGTETAASRERNLTTQLSAREEEVTALREQILLVAKEMDTWRSSGKALNAQLEAAQRARDAEAGKLTVAANQARMHEEAAQMLRTQLAQMGEKECAPLRLLGHSHASTSRACYIAVV